MANCKVFMVVLRQPRLKPRRCSDEPDKRSDPFWEFGSFGCTGCHHRNLLHPRNADNLEGGRLAFAQGGDADFRLVFLSPPVKVNPYKDRLELTWDPGNPAEMPFAFKHAPRLIDSNGESDFRLIVPFLEGTNRETGAEKFASRFRSRKQPLERDLAAQICQVYEQARAAPEKVLAKSYNEALPYDPPCVDCNRAKTLEGLRRELGSLEVACSPNHQRGSGRAASCCPPT